MSKKRRRRITLLKHARRRRDLVRITRRIAAADRIDGYVVGLGRRWVALSVTAEGSPSGFVVLPLRDIKGIDWAPGQRFVRRSLKLQAAWPPTPPHPPLDVDGDVAELVRSVAAVSPLVTIFIERVAPDVCYIGEPRRQGRRKLHLWEVDPDGRWDRRPTPYRWSRITRVDFGGVYETNLHQVSGPRPR